MTTEAPITDVREIARIAYGFKASKALFAAVELNLFGSLSEAPKSADALATEIGCPLNRAESLLTALTALGLLTKNGPLYRNSPACDEYLVPGKPAYFGDYFGLQTDPFIYPAFSHLGELLRTGSTPAPWREYHALMDNPDEATTFSQGQHVGSLGPAVALSRKLDLSEYESMLDVGGGSGAFSIMLCRRNPSLKATIFDYPNALSVARNYVAEAGLDDQIDYKDGNVLETAWPSGHDVVLMSYLLSAVSEDAIDQLLASAFAALAPGGLLVIHDFMANDDKTGPRDAALWFLTCMFNAPDAIVLTPANITSRLKDIAFAKVSVWELIPGLTRVAQAHKETLS